MFFVVVMCIIKGSWMLCNHVLALCIRQYSAGEMMLPWLSKQIRSDRDDGLPVVYSLKGPGADENPVNLFIVNKDGLVKITAILDREQHSEYNVSEIYIRTHLQTCM